MCRNEMEKLPSNFHVAIEGNIGAGKTTLLQGLKKWFSKNNIRANVLPEPVKEWVKFGKSGINYLGLQYSDPKNYSLQFQLVATITKLEQLKSVDGIKFVERSLGAQKQVFLNILKETGKISELNGEIAERLLDQIQHSQPETVPDVIVYLKTTAPAVLTRLRLRNRPEEAQITVEDLEAIQQKYDTWLLQGQPEVVVVEGDDIGNLDLDTIVKNVLKVNNLKYKLK
jgi:deoxyadenosine/deoxycytidine kinase